MNLKITLRVLKKQWLLNTLICISWPLTTIALTYFCPLDEPKSWNEVAHSCLIPQTIIQIIMTFEFCTNYCHENEKEHENDRSPK